MANWRSKARDTPPLAEPPPAVYRGLDPAPVVGPGPAAFWGLAEVFWRLQHLGVRPSFFRSWCAWLGAAGRGVEGLPPYSLCAMSPPAASVAIISSGRTGASSLGSIGASPRVLAAAPSAHFSDVSPTADRWILRQSPRLEPLRPFVLGLDAHTIYEQEQQPLCTRDTEARPSGSPVGRPRC